MLHPITVISPKQSTVSALISPKSALGCSVFQSLAAYLQDFPGLVRTGKDWSRTCKAKSGNIRTGTELDKSLPVPGNPWHSWNSNFCQFGLPRCSKKLARSCQDSQYANKRVNLGGQSLFYTLHCSCYSFRRYSRNNFYTLFAPLKRTVIAISRIK